MCKSLELKQEDISNFIVKKLSEEPLKFKNYGYEVYLPSAMRLWLSDNSSEYGIEQRLIESYLYQVSPYFYNSAWELCRRGILRPGVSQHGQQATDDGSAGNGYSLTPFGQTWLKETDKQLYVPTEEGRFSELIKVYAKDFGSGFDQRAMEAIKCYGAHAYLACCVMCGAAAESILLNIAIKKVGNETEVIEKYSKSNGTSYIRRLLKVDNSKDIIKAGFDIFFDIVKYWRDQAGHGQLSVINESHAFTSLALLLRVCQFVKDNYLTLTEKEVK